MSRAAVAGALMVAALAAAPNALATTISSPYGSVYERVSYGPRLPQVLNIFESPSPNSPIVVLVHGGGWRFQDALSRFASDSMALQQQGFTVFDINYRQDSETKPAFPIEPSDVILATQWAIANASRYHANPGNVVLLGGSAGGHLVALAAEQLNGANPGTIKGVVSLSGPMNLVRLESLVEADTITAENFSGSLEQALGRLPGETVFATTAEREAYPGTWSPAMNVQAQTCAGANWLLYNSETELIPVEQATEMTEALRAAGCKATLQVLPGSKHAFAYFGQIAGAIASFVRAN